MITLGPLTEHALEKDFPECWIILADMMGLEHDLNRLNNDLANEVYSITIYIENEEMIITKESGMSTSANIPKDILTQIIINTIKNNRK